MFGGHNKDTSDKVWGGVGRVVRLEHLRMAQAPFHCKGSAHDIVTQTMDRPGILTDSHERIEGRDQYREWDPRFSFTGGRLDEVLEEINRRLASHPRPARSDERNR